MSEERGYDLLLKSYANTLFSLVNNNTGVKDVWNEVSTLEAMANTILANEPKNSIANYIKGSICFKNKHYAEALSHFEKTRTLSNSTEEFHKKNIIAHSLYHLGHYEAAIPLLENTLEKNADSDMERIMISYALLMTGALKKAEQHYELTDKKELKSEYPDEYGALTSQLKRTPQQPTPLFLSAPQ
jgi:tetratricopeptide (TPR) repeat protein